MKILAILKLAKTAIRIMRTNHHSIKENVMNEIAKKAVARSRKFVEDHKVGITVTVTAACCLMLNRVALKSHDEFLKKHDLYDEFYTVTDEEPVGE